VSARWAKTRLQQHILGGFAVGLVRYLVICLQESRHTRRRLLLAGRRYVTDYIIGSRGRHAHGLLRHNDVIRYAAGTEKDLLRGTWGYHGFGSSDCGYGHHGTAINRSPSLPGS